MSENLRLLRELTNRESDLLNDRTNIFLLWQSILMAGFALGDRAKLISIILPVLGLLSSIVWLYISHLNRLTSKYYWLETIALEKALPDQERIFTKARSYRKRKQVHYFKISISDCIAYILPILWSLVWLISLITTVLGQ